MEGAPAFRKPDTIPKRRIMKAFRLFLAVVFAIVLIAACTSKEKKELTGKWQNDKGKVVFEFTPDGKLNAKTGAATISTDYKVDKDQLKVDLGIFGTGTLKYVLAKDDLTITDAKGEATKYSRVKQTKEAAVKEAPAQAQVHKEQPKAQPEKQPAAAHAPAEQHKAQPEAHH
jgi:hypothetical protein